MSPLEICGVVTGAACVLLAMKENILCWPIGIANNALFFVMFWRNKVYALSCMQLLYIAVAIYGWWRWSHSESGAGAQRIRSISRAIALTLMLLVPLAWAAVYQLLRHYTDSNVPACDSLVTVLSLAAQYMAGRKLLENWLLWIAVDLISSALFLYKHLYLTSFLYAAFVVMCVAGYLAWRKTQLQQGGARAASTMHG
ncbi:MAG: nicotinamide riboside transporter PnuC [Candidatus Korobacteraceae bacterium]|jgi:nicotinamide mononucleotide transporter